MFQKCIYTTLTLLWFVAATAHASIIVPAGLNPGDTYHLAFVTKGIRNATSASIADYNAFVQAEAAQNPSLSGTDVGVTWRAIASTNFVHARDNALVEAPVYLLNGTTKIADGYTDMWDGSIDAPFILDQFADSFPWPAPGVWTGSTPFGTKWQGSTLGSSTVMVGGDHATDGGWLYQGVAPRSGSRYFYALSEELTVPTAVPEPASVVLWLGLASVLGVGARLRRRPGRRV